MPRPHSERLQASDSTSLHGYGAPQPCSALRLYLAQAGGRLCFGARGFSRSDQWEGQHKSPNSELVVRRCRPPQGHQTKLFGMFAMECPEQPVHIRNRQEMHGHQIPKIGRSILYTLRALFR
jgi:hypothetical protein